VQQINFIIIKVRSWETHTCCYCCTFC